MILRFVCAFVQSIGSKGRQVGKFDLPWDLALTPDQAQLVVADTGNRRLVVLDATDGRPVSALTPPAGVTPLPMGVAIVPHTVQVLVVDSYRHQVLLFDSIHASEVFRTYKLYRARVRLSSRSRRSKNDRRRMGCTYVYTRGWSEKEK